ncbi:MAG: hypothetical protein NC400_01425 [Clostridium sp.]|nr:hypothetical protein [Clostridium sp.]
MGKVNANKKLELVKAIRMQNQYNRQLFRSRENFIYSKTPETMHGELYSLEEPKSPEEDAPIASNFRVRFVIALALLFAFVLCDVNQVSYEGENAGTVFERIVESPDLTDVFDFLKSDIP